MKRTTLSLALLFATAMCGAENAMTPMQNFMQQSAPQQEHEIVIHNRPLARVNGKTISLMDVVERMDMIILSRHPEAFHDKPLLIQYYNSSWKANLEEMINNELILADAEDKEMEISEGDIRKKLEDDYRW